MSLVSASEGAQGNRRSAYQAEGKPLSKEALYRAQLKYGVYQTPANGAGTGLADSKAAPGEAANRANSNQKSIEAYKRMFVHADASKAATRAQKDVPRSFSLGENDGGAAEVLEQSGNPLLGNMDITKVLSGAERAAEKRIGERLNPEKVNYVYGLRTGEELKHEGKAYTLTSDGIGRINAKSNADQDKEIDPNNYAGHASAAALLPKTRWKGVDRSDIEYRVMSADYVKNMNSQQVLALARARADEKLKRIDKENKEKNIFSNEEYNKAAVEIAKKHFEERDRLYGGKVNLGGGLWLKAEEVEQIAQGIVTPVLSDVDKRVYQQRLVDEEIQQRTLTHEQEYAQWKSLQDQKLANDELLLKEAAERHEMEEADASSTLKKKYNELVAENEELISAKEAELQRAREALEELQKENEKSVADSNSKVEKDLADLETVHKADLGDLRKEFDDETQPLLQDLEEKERKHQQLLQSREASKGALSDVVRRLEVEKAKKEELEGDLAHSNEKLAEQEDGLYALETKEQELEGAIEELEQAAREAEEEAKLAIAEVKEREVEFENSMDRRKSELKHIESKLDDEYRQLEGSNSYIAELKEGVAKTREQLEREQAAAKEAAEREAAEREQARQALIEEQEVSSGKPPSEYHAETGKATRATRAAEPHVFVSGMIYPEPRTRAPLPARHSTGSINPRKQQPQVVNKKQSKGVKTGIPHRRDSAFGKFLHKIIPPKKAPAPSGPKKSGQAPSRAPPTKNQGFQRVRPSQARPTGLNEAQQAKGPSSRPHRRAPSGAIDEDDADILERSKVGKKKSGSLFTEIF